MYSWFAPGWEEYLEKMGPQKKFTPPKKNPEVKVEEMFTLSIYACGKHRTSGEILPIDIEMERLDFAESLLPLRDMIQKFKDCRLGSKIRVTLEVID